jgi:serine protease AprX
VTGRLQGEGRVDLAALLDVRPRDAVQRWEPAQGGGSLELSRGSDHLTRDGVMLTGEQDIFGAPFDARRHARLEVRRAAWDGGTWNGNSWSGNSWSGDSWSGNSWSGNSWSGNSWSGDSWSGNSWSGNSWSGDSWSGNSWSGRDWSGNSWSHGPWE